MASTSPSSTDQFCIQRMVVYSFYIFDRHGKLVLSTIIEFKTQPLNLSSDSRMYLPTTMASATNFRQAVAAHVRNPDDHSGQWATGFGELGRRRD